MNHSDTLGMSVNFEVVQIKKGNTTNTIASVPTEVPLTIVANNSRLTWELMITNGNLEIKKAGPDDPAFAP